MNKKIFATATVFASLMGIAQLAHADPAKHTFTPIDDLAPNVRSQINNEITALTSHIHIDWDTIIVGVDENGEIILRSKAETQTYHSTYQMSGTFSCLSAKGCEDVSK